MKHLKRRLASRKIMRKMAHRVEEPSQSSNPNRSQPVVLVPISGWALEIAGSSRTWSTAEHSTCAFGVHNGMAEGVGVGVVTLGKKWERRKMILFVDALPSKHPLPMTMTTSTRWANITTSSSNKRDIKNVHGRFVDIDDQ